MDEEIYTDESQDRKDRKVTTLSREGRARKIKIESEDGSITPNTPGRTKYPQKFCEKWMDAFQPWLSRCKNNPSKPFCLACQCRLDCNKCHLQRHEKTSKHERNLDIFLSGGERAAQENFSIRQERSKYYHQRKKSMQNASAYQLSDADDMDTCEMYLEECSAEGDSMEYAQNETIGSNGVGNERNYTDLTEFKQEISSEDSRSTLLTSRHMKTEKVVVKRLPSSLPKNTPPTKKDPMKLFMQIQKDKTDLLESFKELIESNNIVAPIKCSPPQEKNSVDLFFESVSSTVKALKPKLIAEAKMRISQLVCELELRAITENSPSPNSNRHRSASSSAVKLTTMGLEASRRDFILSENLQKVENVVELR